MCVGGVCVCVWGGGGETINMPICTEGSGMPTMRPKTGFPGWGERLKGTI